MSLINDALKKAQKLQTQQPTAAATPAAPISARMAGHAAVGMNLERMVLLVVALVAVIVGATAVALLLLRKDDRPVVAQAAIPPPPLLVTANPPAPSHPISAVPAPVRTSPERSAIAARPVVPSTPPPPIPVAPKPPAVHPVSAPMTTGATARSSAPPVSLPPPAAPAVSVNPSASAETVAAEVAPAPPAAQPAPPVPTPPPDPAAEKKSRIFAFIESMHIAGVRLAGDDSKVLMNDHVYRVNSLVNMELGLRLAGVKADVLTFVDENGAVYTKTF